MKKESKTKKNARNILNIHTHNSADGRNSIINYSLQPLFRTCLVSDKNSYSEKGIQDILIKRILRVILSLTAALYNFLVIYIAPLNKGTWYSIGVHPENLLHESAMVQWMLFKKLYSHKQAVAIGEAGLDKLTPAKMELQIKLFELQARYAELAQKPLIVHCVKAMEELLAVKQDVNPIQPWIWHGFRGKPEQANQLLAKGFYLSFGVHYPDETMAMVPADRLFLETDNEDEDIELLLQRAAAIRGVEPDDLRETIRENVEKVFFKG